MSSSNQLLINRSLARMLVVVLCCSSAGFADESIPPGKDIYVRLCADCHGQSGAGDPDVGTGPLLGDKPLAQLASYIADTMPQDSPEDCEGDEAAAVARFIFDEFYSPAAQARRAPARIDLVRLTERQYRNTICDLIGSFRWSFEPKQERGLEGRYFNQNRPTRKADLERQDATIDLKFGPSSLPPEPLDPIKGFAAQWRGSLLAPTTGEYKITVRTNQAIRFWLNDNQQPLIDAWVQSGDQTEYTASIHLLGGRAYPLRLEFTSRQQGVEDQKKYDQQPREMFVQLRWAPPGRPDQPIAARFFAPKRGPEVFVSSVPFPPDDRSHGYLRGISVSKAWDEATTAAAVEAAAYITTHLDELAKTTAQAEDRSAKLREFCQKFVERAFRRPIEASVEHLYIQRRFDEAPDIETAVKRVVLMTLKSPRMLYLDFDPSGLDDYDTASFLSYALWDSCPDEQLMLAAAKGQLRTLDEISTAANRMIRNPRAESKLRAFLHSWLQLDEGHDLAKDSARFPGFDELLIADLRTSLELTLDDIIWSETGNFKDLLQTNEIYLNGRLAAFYGYDLPPEAPFQKVPVKVNQRQGIITHPFMLATLAYTDFTSPIHRGVFLLRNVLGRTLRPPPAAFAPASPDLHPEMTTRERVAMQTKPAECRACHSMINPLGYTLEHFDAVGRFRETENGRPIDSRAVYAAIDGQEIEIADAQQLTEFLAGNEQTERAFARQLFHYLLKQPANAFGDNTIDQAADSFATVDYNVPRLMSRIATQAAVNLLQLSSANVQPGATSSRQGSSEAAVATIASQSDR
jgi:cytochrome c5